MQFNVSCLMSLILKKCCHKFYNIQRSKMLPYIPVLQLCSLYKHINTSAIGLQHLRNQRVKHSTCAVHQKISAIREAIRFMSTQRKSETVLNVFDRKAKCWHRNCAAIAEDVAVYDYLKEEIGSRVADRMYDIPRKFHVAVELGCGRGYIGKHLTSENVGVMYQCDMSEKYLEQSQVSESVQTYKMVVDDEFLPFPENSVDVFVSSLNLHWVNDLPGTFKQIHNALKGDGAFIASLFGGDTLYELRSSLQLAELEREGGFALHISPFVDAQDIGGLLNRAGFTMLTIDADEIIVNYPTMFELMWDLKGMAENNASWSRKSHLHRDTMLAASAIYKDRYGNKDETIPATFQVLYLIGWKPHESQAQPAKRGSATASLKDLSKLNQSQSKKDK